MSALLSIGDFAKATYLTVKALRHYQETALLEPHDVDPTTGYRRYRSDQIPRAQLIRRMRDLEVPIDQLKIILGSDPEHSRGALRAHLDRMRVRLDETAGTVLTLQTMLGEAPDVDDVVWKHLDPVPALVIEAEIAFSSSESWLSDCYAELHATVAELGCRVVGADGARWSEALFTAGSGTGAAFVPIDCLPTEAPSGRMFVATTLPGGLTASTIHRGAFADLDLAYGRVASAVAARNRNGSGPVQEHYLGANRCEVLWRVAD